MRSDPLSPDNGGVSGTAYSSANRLSACSSQVHSTTGTGVGLPPLPNSLGRALGRLLVLFVAFALYEVDKSIAHSGEDVKSLLCRSGYPLR